MPTENVINKLSPESDAAIKNILGEEHLFSILVSKSGESQLVFANDISDADAKNLKGSFAFSFPPDDERNERFAKNCVIFDGKRIC